MRKIAWTVFALFLFFALHGCGGGSGSGDDIDRNGDSHSESQDIEDRTGEDRDGDGYSENQGDCDDTDASVNPGATDDCGDGTDQDCDGTDADCADTANQNTDSLDTANQDKDGDGYSESQGDCNDSDASVNPGAEDTCDDGTDQDCDGRDGVCDSDADTTPPDTGDTVRDFARDMETSMTAGDVDAFMERISKNYMHNGQDYACSAETRTWEFARYTYSDVSYVINGESYESNDGKELALIDRTLEYTLNSGQEPNSSTDNMMLVLEDGKWKLYGNQVGYQSTVIADIVTCERYDSSTGELVGVKSRFTKGDEQVTVFVTVNNARNGSAFGIRCYRPNGSPYSDSTYEIKWGDYPECVSFTTHWDQSYSLPNYEDIPGVENQWRENVGTWRIEVSEYGTYNSRIAYFEVAE